MVDSADEVMDDRPAKRQKRFTFQRFSQRVAQVRKLATTLVETNMIIAVPHCIVSQPRLQRCVRTALLNWTVARRWTLTFTVGLAMFAMNPCLGPHPSFRCVKTTIFGVHRKQHDICLTLHCSTCRSKLLSAVSSTAPRCGWQLQPQSIPCVSLCPYCCTIRYK